MTATSAEQDDRSWHFERDGRAWGPVSDDELLELLRTKEIAADTPVWREGMEDWWPLDAILIERAGAASGAAGAAPPLAPVLLSYETPGGPDHVRYAGFGERLAAYIVDQIILVAAAGAVVAGLYLLGTRDAVEGLQGIAFFIGWPYYAVMESSRHQGTPGKLLLRIKVTDEHRRPVTFARATGRYFGKILSSILYLGFIAAAFTRRKQALHDQLAGCLVVKHQRD